MISKSLLLRPRVDLHDAKTVPAANFETPGFKYKRSVLSIWNGGLHNASITFDVVALAKRAAMFSPTKFKSDILDCFASYFEPVKDCLEKLRSIIFPPEFLSDDKETLSDTVNDKEEIQKLPPKLQNFLRKMVSSVDTPPIHFQKIKDVLDETIEEFKKRNLHIRTARPPPPTVDHSHVAHITSSILWTSEYFTWPKSA